MSNLFISSRVVAKSKNVVTGDTITTFELVYPRIIHAELLTHRLFSRNTASSRAVPVKKMIERVENMLFVPEYWGKNQSGMQAYQEIDSTVAEEARLLWIEAATNALDSSRKLADLKVHKQLANRLTEPFQYIQVVLTSTCFRNWFRLRDHEAAQPEIRALAQSMKVAYEDYTADELVPGEWHLPYVYPYGEHEEEALFTLEKKQLMSVARCARVSYFLRDGGRSDPSKDVVLARRLLNELHMSPFEHPACATPNKCMIGNFNGFMQLRKFIMGENNGDLYNYSPFLSPYEANELMGGYYQVDNLIQEVQNESNS